MIFLLWKSPLSSILIIKYFSDLLKAKALLAGMVQGVVVQMMISQPYN